MYSLIFGYSINRKMHKFLVCLLLFVFYNNSAQVPKLGNDSTFEFATWNVYWLGDNTPGNGPADETLQYNNVKQFIQQSDLDLIAIQELSNLNTYYQLNKDLSKYASMLSDIDQVQKMGLFWKKSHFNLIQAYSYTILNDQSYNFGRAPMQVCLQLNNDNKDTIFFIVLHMKAFGDQDSYNRRMNASIGLKAYIETSLQNKKYVILGDWNDDLNYSTYQKMVSPYQNLLNAGYHFPTKELTDQGKRSYAYSKVMFDHILHCQLIQDSFYIPNSSAVFDIAPNYIINFSRSTSDHYPVYAQYNFKLATEKGTGYDDHFQINQFDIYPNPSNSMIWISNTTAPTPYAIFNSLGELVLSGIGCFVDIEKIPSGIYLIERKGYRVARFCKYLN